MMTTPALKSSRTQILGLFLAGLIAQPAHAQVIPGRWEKVSNLDFGTPITVELKSGDQVGGDFDGLSASELEIKTRTALATIPKTDVQTITTPPKDGLGEGALIGAATGAGLVGILASSPHFSSGKQ